MAITIGDNPSTAAQRAQLADLLNTPLLITADATIDEQNSGENHVVESATPVALTLPSAGTVNSTRIRGVNIGVGVVSFVATGADTIFRNAVLPETIDQYSPFELLRVTGGWMRVA